MSSRAERILDPRTRIFGQDLPALGEQRMDLQRRRLLESENLRNEALRLNELDAVREKVHSSEQALRRQTAIEVSAYNQSQRRDQRSSISFGSPGPASMQSFAGEDPEAKQRGLAQRQELVNGLAVQLASKRSAAVAESDMKLQADHSTLNAGRVLAEIHDREQENRKKLAMEMAETNRSLSEAKRSLNSARKSKENESAQKDLAYHINSAPILRDRSTAVMSVEEKECVLEIVKGQQKEGQDRKERARHEALKIAADLNQQKIIMDKIAADEIQKKREQEKSTVEFNKKLSEKRQFVKSNKSQGIDFDSGYFAGFARSDR